jgi:hypothetical protein
MHIQQETKESNLNKQYFQAVTPGNDKNQPELTFPTTK